MEPQAAFRELAQLLLRSPLDEVLDRVARLARRSLPGADGVSVTLMEGDLVRSAAYAGDLALQLDERQHAHGSGPCLHAALTGEVVDIPDTATERTYADFAREARRAGVTHVMAVGLLVSRRTVGALNVYGTHGGGFDDEAHVLAGTFASYAAVALANAALRADADARARQLESAMASRAVIEQAKGMLMAKRRCSADEAFALLVTISQQTHRKLRDVAQQVVDGRGRP